jgi:hypothetical protein
MSSEQAIYERRRATSLSEISSFTTILRIMIRITKTTEMSYRYT